MTISAKDGGQSDGENASHAVPAAGLPRSHDHARHTLDERMALLGQAIATADEPERTHGIARCLEVYGDFIAVRAARESRGGAAAIGGWRGALRRSLGVVRHLR